MPDEIHPAEAGAKMTVLLYGGGWEESKAAESKPLKNFVIFMVKFKYMLPIFNIYV